MIAKRLRRKSAGSLLDTCHGIGLPTTVPGIQFVRAQVTVADTTIDEKSGVLQWHPRCIKIQTGQVTLDNITISGVQQIVLVEAVLLDGVVANRLIQLGIDHQFRCVDVIHQSDVM